MLPVTPHHFIRIAFVSSQIASEILQFAHLFGNHPELKRPIVVRACDRSPALCLFAYDRIRLRGLF